MKPPEPGAIDRVASWLGIDLDDHQRRQLITYADWLGSEGVAIGGIGPGELDRIWDRHILDSLTFGHGLADDAAVLDVGTGVGLPGIPLAIAYPGGAVTLLERSGRRSDALHRVTRLLGLAVTIATDDVARHRGAYDRVVMRAALRPEHAASLLPLLRPGGVVVVGLGRGPNPPETSVDGERVEVDRRVLENGGWLLMIRDA